jgi:lysophospholipase L1-like esterase
VTGLIIYHNGGKTEFAFADAHGNNVGDIDHLFAENAVVKVILDVTTSMAFVQNADTNAYIERTFVKSVNGQAPDEKGNVEIEIPEGGGNGGGTITGLITPDMLDLRANWGADADNGETETGEIDITDTLTFVKGQYKKQDGSKIATVTIGAADLSEVCIHNLVGGDVIRFASHIANGGLDGGYIINHFIFATDNDETVIPVADIPNYVVYEGADTNTYRVTIPNGATKMYTARTTASVSELRVYKIGNTVVENAKFNIGWLEITEKNLPNNFYEKVAEEVVNTIPTEEGGNSRLITHNPYGRIDFNNKTIVSYGDSITYGAYATTPYIKALATRFSATLTNRAVSSTTVSGTATNSTNVLIANNDDSGKDFIVIAGGTNDWTLGNALGSYGDATNETFYGALDVICNHLKTNAPNAKVIFITPINRFLHGVRPVATLNAYRQAITETALKYGFAVVDGRQLGMPNTSDTWAKEMLPDGLHPSDLGHSVMCNSLIGILA